MTYINPITGSALPAAQAQQTQATEKTRQLRQKEAVRRNIAAASDTFEHTVENTEAVAPTSDEQRPKQETGNSKGKKKQKEPSKNEPEKHIDLRG